jgi:hypothetical protein
MSEAMSNGQVTLDVLPQKPVFLITEKERLSFTFAESTFWYRRLPPSKRHELLTMHAQRGTFDLQSVAGLQLAIATYCIRGWENVLDANMQPVPFLEEVIPYLPWEVIQRMDQLAMETSPDQLMERYTRFLTAASSSSPPAPASPSPAGIVERN